MSKVNSKLIQWLVVWLSTDPEAALPYLRTLVSKDTQFGRELAVELTAGLSRPRFRFVVPEAPKFMELPWLGELLLLIFEQVRPADDILRDNEGALTPTPRDDAQLFRGILLEKLASIPGTASHAYLQQLVEQTNLGRYRDYLQKTLEEHSRISVSLRRWSLTDVLNFRNRSTIETGGFRIDSLYISSTEGDFLFELNHSINVFIEDTPCLLGQRLDAVAKALLPVYHPYSQEEPELLTFAHLGKIGEIRTTATNGLGWSVTSAQAAENAAAAFAHCDIRELASNQQYVLPLIFWYRADRNCIIGPSKSDSMTESRLAQIQDAFDAARGYSKSLRWVQELIDSQSPTLGIVDATLKFVVGEASLSVDEFLSMHYSRHATNFRRSDAALALLVIDLCRRFYLANPRLPAPMEAEAIVLIEALEAYLPPRIQVGLLPRLASVFPNTQFIVNTSSPFLLRALEEKDYKLFKVPHYFGYDESLASWHLDEISSNFFDVPVSWSEAIDEDLEKFREIASDPRQVGRAYTLYRDLISSNNARLQATVRRLYALYGSERLQRLVQEKS